ERLWNTATWLRTSMLKFWLLLEFLKALQKFWRIVMKEPARDSCMLRSLTWLSCWDESQRAGRITLRLPFHLSVH
ncbi:hypothetical protein HDU99_008251, partial [Rhizoclosmatium hyalinum]